MLTRRDNLLVRPWQQRRFNQHRNKVVSALPAIDVGPPPERAHVSCKLKQAQREEERCARVSRENCRLVQRLAYIMRTSRVDNVWRQQPPTFLHRVGIYMDPAAPCRPLPLPLPAHGRPHSLADSQESQESTDSEGRNLRCSACHPRTARARAGRAARARRKQQQQQQQQQQHGVLLDLEDLEQSDQRLQVSPAGVPATEAETHASADQETSLLAVKNDDQLLPDVLGMISPLGSPSPGRSPRRGGGRDVGEEVGGRSAVSAVSAVSTGRRRLAPVGGPGALGGSRGPPAPAPAVPLSSLDQVVITYDALRLAISFPPHASVRIRSAGPAPAHRSIRGAGSTPGPGLAPTSASARSQSGLWYTAKMRKA